MKLLLTTISIALASTAVAAGSPGPADPVAAEAGAEAPAPSPEQLVLARKFVALVGLVHNPLDGLESGAWHEASAEIADKAARAEAQQRVSQMVAELKPKVSKRLPAIAEAYAAAYAREFSADELRQMIAFAQTPAGRHYIAEAAVLELDDPIVEAETEMWEDVAPVFEEMRRVMCAEKAAQRIASGEVKAKCPLSAPDTASG